MKPILGIAVFAMFCTTAGAQSPRKDIPSIAKAATGAIVTIVMANGDKPIATGTGFLVNTSGVIVTNYHVIQEGNVAVVKLADGTALPVDGVLAADKVRDLAIIKVHGKTFRTLTLGNSDRIQVGEDVVAIGNPLGLELTVSNGILSGVRTVEEEGGKFLQITAPISHGSSGGPLFNMQGEVVGITSMYFAGGENLNFAIPVNDAKRLLLNQATKLQNLPNEPSTDNAATTQDSGDQGDDLKETLSWMQTSLDSISNGGIVSLSVPLRRVSSTKLVEYSGCRVHFRHEIKQVGNHLIDDSHIEVRILDSSEIVFNLGEIDPERISAEPYPYEDAGDDPSRAFGAYSRNNEKKIIYTEGNQVYPAPSMTFPLSAEYAVRFTKAFKHAVAICGGKPSKF
jgi:hypothetical protein